MRESRETMLTETIAATKDRQDRRSPRVPATAEIGNKKKKDYHTYLYALPHTDAHDNPFFSLNVMQ